MTQIAVDWQVSAADKRHYDVLFIGTGQSLHPNLLLLFIYYYCPAMRFDKIRLLNLFSDDGRVLKAINSARQAGSIEPIIIDTFKLFNTSQPITGLHIHRSRLVVMSTNEIQSIPLHTCHMYSSCRFNSIYLCLCR